MSKKKLVKRQKLENETVKETTEEVKYTDTQLNNIIKKEKMKMLGKLGVASVEEAIAKIADKTEATVKEGKTGQMEEAYKELEELNEMLRGEIDGYKKQISASEIQFKIDSWLKDSGAMYPELLRDKVDSQLFESEDAQKMLNEEMDRLKREYVYMFRKDDKAEQNKFSGIKAAESMVDNAAKNNKSLSDAIREKFYI